MNPDELLGRILEELHVYLCISRAALKNISNEIF